MQVGRIRGGSKIYMKEALAIIGLVLIITITGEFLIDKASCKNKYQEFQPQYSLLGGCKVMWSGRLTPIDIIREIN